MIITIKKLLNKVGIDGAVALTILTRVIQAGGGIISIIFVSRYLSPSEIGYYYTFSSILAIQIFFELGLSGIITQYTAYESAHLKWIDNFELIGEIHYQSRLSSLLIFCVKWFAIIAAILFFALLYGGFTFFSHYGKGLNIEWKGAWITLCLTTSLNLFIDPLLAFFDGLGHVKDMAKIRLVQKTVYIILMFIFFACGLKLYSAALASLIAICVNYAQIIFTNRIKYLKVIWAAKSEWVISYFKEIFPFQWRIALSWISGYFIFQLFNPILFATEGAVVAGQMGMSIAALTGILSISMSWINTKVPFLSNLISKRDYTLLDVSFNRIAFQATGINLLITICFVLVIQVFKLFHVSLAERFLAFIPLICMCLANVINQLIYAFATYLRCHKKEPMLIQSITMGLLVCLSTVVLGRRFGLIGITTSYVFLTCMVALPWTIYLFITRKKAWHHE
ncbi:hypothetical protein G7092_11655 [Mucilaginibacter sp. HC2]|uniref:lipopolysaccharide biosynthesis protein n=1 Tax=Mucilaginibacter inviolabilis TaxID=2714892 RepID=UPI00140D3CBE|nr:hypothetical protein [Mucilaginibacter inviolabilis]NHA04458.1 hypothetical protein [Mucilaginibacter inviolabilis]